MKGTIFALLTASSLMVSASANAAFSYVDWNTAGDKKAIIDSDTGIEWLRLAETKGKSMDAVIRELNTTYKGWRFPTNAEVTAAITFLYNGANMQFNEITARSGNYNYWVGANRFADLFGNGYKQTSHHLGLYRDEDNIIRRFGGYYNENGAYTISYGLENTASYASSSAAGGYMGGVFLVSDGGTTISSKNNPNLNINNPNAPINQRPVGGSAITAISTGTVYANLQLSYSGTSNFVGYKYKVNGGAEQTVVGNQLNITGLTAGTQYTIEYAAYNNSGTGDWYSTTAVTQVSAPVMAMSGLMMLLMGLRRRAGIKDAQSV